MKGDIMEFVEEFYHYNHVNLNPLPDAPEDMLYREELLRYAKKYPIKSMKIIPDYSRDYQYLYLFETEEKLSYKEVSRIERDLIEHMEEYGVKLGIPPMKYVILENKEYYY